MRESFLVQMLASTFLLSFISSASAESGTYPELKPTGVSLEWYQHELDLDVISFDANVPGLTPETAALVKNQLSATSNLELVNIRLDRQVHPDLNIYGSIGKVTSKTDVSFSALSPGLSDMEIDNAGTAYTVGAHLSKAYGQWKPKLHYFHSRLQLDENSEDIRINTVIPSIGLQTEYGAFSADLVYQAVDATYSGTIEAPILGEIPVSVDTENNDKIQIAAGWQKQVAKDWFLNTKVGLNGQKQLQIRLNKRF